MSWVIIFLWVFTDKKKKYLEKIQNVSEWRQIMGVKGLNGYPYSNTRKKDKPFIRFRLRAVFLIVILVFAVCFGVYMAEVNINSKKINSVGFSADGSAFSSSSESETTPSAEPEKPKKNIVNPVPASSPLTETYFGKCFFVGDSISVGLADYQFVPVRNVFAELGMNIEKINTETITTVYGKLTAIDTIKAAQPENVYIMLGSNGIAWLSVPEMTEYYSKFIDDIKTGLPDAKIYILSVPPVTAERETAAKDPIQNSAIDAYNSELLKLADEKQIYYVDINTALKGNDGKFPSDMAESDGMHFVKTTYSVMLDYILSHTVE